MKTLKLRFVERRGDFLVQRKTWFGWKYIGYTINMGYGSVYNLYCEKTKESLLNTVLEKFYKVDKRFTQIIEYPQLKYI
jgi:hypothetical protein